MFSEHYSNCTWCVVWFMHFSGGGGEDNKYLLWSLRAGSWSRHGQTGDTKASLSHLENHLYEFILVKRTDGAGFSESVRLFFLLKKDNLIGKSLATPPDILDYPNHWWSHHRLFSAQLHNTESFSFLCGKGEARQGGLELACFAWIAPNFAACWPTLPCTVAPWTACWSSSCPQ